MTEKTRARVLAAADALDFVPDLQAPGRCGSAGSGVVGLLTDVMATTPCSIDIVRGVERGARGARMSLLIGNLSEPL